MPPERPVVRDSPDTHISSTGAAIAGIGLNSALLASVKIVVLTPMPSASVAIAATANIGVRDSERSAYRKPCLIVGRSLAAKRRDRIHPRGPSSRDPAREQTDDGQQHRHDGKR